MLDEEAALCAGPMGADVPLEPHKFLLVLLYLSLAGLSNWMTLSYIHDISDRKPLPDLLMKFVPEQGWAHKVGDSMVFVCATIMLGVVAAHKHRVILLRRVLFILGSLYWTRTLTMIVTPLPSAYYDNDAKCKEQLRPENRTLDVYWHRLLEQTVHIGFQDVEQKMLCGDLLFSGHTLVMAVSFLTVDYYLPNHWKGFSMLPRLCMLFGMLCLVLSRTHYCIDVLFAYWLSSAAFSVYHAFCEIETYRERRNSVLSKIWMIKMVAWLERSVIPGRLENHLHIPGLKEVKKIWEVQQDDQ